jgi:hypothetical protein
MKTQTVTTYTIKELAEEFPKSADKAFHQYVQGVELYDDFQAIRESKKAFVDFVYSQIYRIYQSPVFHAREGLKNPTTIELSKHERFERWVNSHFLSKLEKGKFIWKGRGESRISKLNTEISCPFTGICYDHDFLDLLIHSTEVDGQTLIRKQGEKYNSLSPFCIHEFFAEMERQANDLEETLIQQEVDYRTSWKCFVEECEIMETQFTKDGREWIE